MSKTRHGRFKARHRMPDYTRKAGPHMPHRTERKSSRRDAERRAIEESC